MRHHHEPMIVTVVGAILLFGLILFMAFAIDATKKRLDDPLDTGVVFLAQLPALALLAGSGRFLIQIYRQSHNLHASYEVTGTARDAMEQAMATFRRAGIDAIGILTNTADELKVRRAFMSYRGRASGKKVGWMHITRLA